MAKVNIEMDTQSEYDIRSTFYMLAELMGHYGFIVTIRKIDRSKEEPKKEEETQA